MGWLLVLGLKECLVECATLCIESEVMLIDMYFLGICAHLVLYASRLILHYILIIFSVYKMQHIEYYSGKLAL